MQKRITLTVVAGLIAGLLLVTPGSSALFSVVAPFFPLMLLGLSEGVRAAFHAGCIGILLVMLIGGDQAGFNMAMFIVLPASLLLHRLLRYRVSHDGHIEWYSSLRAISELTFLAAALFLAISVSAGHEQPNGIRGILQKSLILDFNAMEPEVADIMRKITGDWSFFLFASGAWIWATLTWFTAWFSNHLLQRSGKNLRPDVAITPLGVPKWFLGVLVVSALLALGGGENDQFTGKTLFLIGLLPYFLSGMGIIHRMSAHWRPARFWLFLIYIVLVFQAWTTVFPILAGLYAHLSEMLDKPKKIG